MIKFLLKSCVGLTILLFAMSVVARGPAIQGDWKADQIADGVYVVHGPIGVPSVENQGFMNNPGFILTEEGVVVVDPGGSVQVGEMLLELIAAVTAAPVVAVFDTHIHGDHWFANHAIKEKYPEVKIYAHQQMIDHVINGAGDEWFDMSMRLTNFAIEGTKIVNASYPVKNADVISIGGVEFIIHHNVKAHTDTDIMIEVASKSVMFLGDNCSINRVIRHDHGSVKGNIEALDIAIATGSKIFVPGHGPSSFDAAKQYREYLAIVYAGVKVAYDDGLSDFEIKPLLIPQLQKWSHWDDFDRVLGKQIGGAFSEIEEANF